MLISGLKFDFPLKGLWGAKGGIRFHCSLLPSWRAHNNIQDGGVDNCIRAKRLVLIHAHKPFPIPSWIYSFVVSDGLINLNTSHVGKTNYCAVKNYNELWFAEDLLNHISLRYIRKRRSSQRPLLIYSRLICLLICHMYWSIIWPMHLLISPNKHYYCMHG